MSLRGTKRKNPDVFFVDDSNDGNTNPTKKGKEEDAGTSEDVELASTSISRMTSSRGGIQHETGVSPYPTIQSGYLDTITTKLRFHGNFDVVGVGLNSTIQNMQIRMTSIYDVIKSTINAAATSNSIRESSREPKLLNATTIQQPTWRDEWADKYEYYSVIQCNWKLTVKQSDTGDDLLGMIATMYSTSVDPPVTSLVSLENIKFWKRVDNIVYTGPQYDGEPNVQVITGTYWPGKHKREVRDDTEASVWTLCTANPTLEENLNIIFGRAALSSNNDIAYYAYIELDYIVQFKDLKTSYQFPISTTSRFPQDI